VILELIKDLVENLLIKEMASQLECETLHANTA
jgi:hypothetical protein